MSGTSRGARKGWERRREAEECVVANLAPEHQALWKQVRKGIVGAPHARFEAFEQYQHDHPGEAIAALQESADAEVDRLIALREAS